MALAWVTATESPASTSSSVTVPPSWPAHMSRMAWLSATLVSMWMDLVRQIGLFALGSPNSRQ